MKQLYTNNHSLIKKNSQKLLKLKDLLQSSKLSQTLPFPRKNLEASLPILDDKSNKHLDKFSDNLSVDLSKDFSLYLSLIERPINLLFSIDQFLFEFSKKSYQQKKAGEFFQQLKERKKLSLFYGHLTKKQIINLFNKVKKNKGYFSKNLFCLLERRLDIVLYRSGIAKTVVEARQLIKHKKIKVNNNLINIPSFFLNPGDIISITPETAEKLSNKLVKSLKTKLIKNHPKIFGDFYSKFKKTLEKSLNSHKSADKNFSFGAIETAKTSFQQTFRSRLFCNLLIQLLCTRIKLRSFLNLKENVFDVSLTNYSNLSPTNYRIQNIYSASSNKINQEKTVLTLLKWKSNSSLKKSISKKKHFFYNFNNLQDILYACGGSLQKKPLFWRRRFIDSKNKFSYLKNQKTKQIQQNAVFIKDQKDKKSFKTSNYKKRNLALYRNSFLIFLKYLENYNKFTNLLILNMKKFLFKKSYYKQNLSFSKDLTFRVIKPIHLEVSYNLLNVIFLYLPQRLNFPFYIDLDLIKRSLR